MKSTDEIFDSCRFLSEVARPGRERLNAIATWCRFARGQLIFQQDDPCPGIYIVASGQVRVFKVAASGKEHVLHLVGPGQTFAEVASIGGFACPASAEALEPTECVLLPREAFDRALREDHAMCLQIIGGLSGWVRQLVGLMEDIVLRDATSRVASFLLQAAAEPDGAVTLPGLKKHLASHLNLTSETLSRSLRRLEEAGLIAPIGAGQLRVADREGLSAASVGSFPRL